MASNQQPQILPTKQQQQQMQSKPEIEEMSGYQPPEVTSSTTHYPSSYDDYYDQGN
jgi:hypothetical protein